MAMNVILTAYSCSVLAPCQKWAEQYFSSPPLIINIPGSSGSAFRSKILSWAKSGDVFTAAVAELAPQRKGEIIDKRGLVTFSAGWAAADELLKLEKERQKLNAYIALDGIHTAQLDHFIAYATLAANTDSFAVFAHSSIVPPFISSSKSNSLIYEAACHNNDLDKERPNLTCDPPDYVINRRAYDKPITIKVGAAGSLRAESQTWECSPLLAWKNRGNLTKLHYRGETRTDHIFIAQVVQPLMWQWLGQVWNGEI